MKRYFYKETGMYIDWGQLSRLPDIDTLVDIGVGANGTEDLYDAFPNARLILIDPLDEANDYAAKAQEGDGCLKERSVKFYKTAVGNVSEATSMEISIEKAIGRSTLLEVSDLNYEGPPTEKRMVKLNSLDAVLTEELNLGRVGIKIDTEGFELDVIKGASKTLTMTKFVIAEVRHNHESFKGVYKLHEFIAAMADNNFILTTILTAKPFIADLCFQPMGDLELKGGK